MIIFPRLLLLLFLKSLHEGTLLSNISRIFCFIIYKNYHLQIYLNNNDYILVHEDGHWNLKGHFSVAIENNEDLEWSLENGQYCAHVMIVIIFL